MRNEGNAKLLWSLDSRTPAPESTAADRVTENKGAVTDLSHVHEGIESQLSLKILLKHNKLYRI
jgi:hypothetical protein